MLAKSCLTEFGAMPPLDQSTFEDWSGPRDSISPKPICEKRLHFGDLDLPREELTGKVYAYLCSGSSNRVAFTVGPNNLTLKPTEMRLVAPTESFLSLYKVPGDFKTTDYVKKAKAYTCLLFLAAGHVRTVEGYVDFSRDLKDACWTIGKAQIESEGSISVDSDIESEVKISKSPEAHVKRERDATDADEDCG